MSILYRYWHITRRLLAWPWNLHYESKKLDPYSFEHSFRKYCPILIVLSLLQREIMCPQTHNWISYFTYSSLLYYLEKCNRIHFFTSSWVELRRYRHPHWVTTFNTDQWQLFTLWTCRQLDVELSWVELRRRRYRHFTDATQLTSTSSWVELCRYKRAFTDVFHAALQRHNDVILLPAIRKVSGNDFVPAGQCTGTPRRARATVELLR